MAILAALVAGWDELAAAADRLTALRPGRTLTLTAGYDVAAELAWHNRHLRRPLSANLGRRMNQYDLWPGLVAAADRPQRVRIERGGRTWRSFLVVRLRGFDGRLDSAWPISSW